MLNRIILSALFFILFTTVKAQNNIGDDLNNYFANKAWTQFAEKRNDTLIIHCAGTEGGEYFFLRNNISYEKLYDTLGYVLYPKNVVCIANPITEELEWVSLSCSPIIRINKKFDSLYLGRFYSEYYTGPVVITIISASLFSLTTYENNKIATRYYNVIDIKEIDVLISDKKS